MLLFPVHFHSSLASHIHTMFSTAASPYDDLVVKATDENLASEDWALNMDVCDKVSSDGQNGARQAVTALQKRLSHRNPNVQIYALELANSLAQNCGKDLLGELSSRNWTSALDRLINDRATSAPVKKKALSFVKSWAKQIEDTGDPNLGLMGEFYDQLRAKNHVFDEPEPTPESAEEARRRQEEEELQRVLELSKQDKGGRSTFTYQPSGSAGASSSSAAKHNTSPSISQSQVQPLAQGQAHSLAAPQVTGYAPQPQMINSAQPLEPEPPKVDPNTATRVRAIYPFTGQEVGELDFERGDVIKVLDRGFKEWWRGACNGKIGIFPVTYVEALPEPTPEELRENAQEEARVFASLGLVDQLLQTLKGIDPARGDKLDDRPEIEEMYQASVALQGQINTLIKKYSDQKAELEHMNANFIRAMGQYEELRNGPPPQMQPFVYASSPPQPQLQQQNSYSYQQYSQQPQQQPQPYVQAPYAQQAPPHLQPEQYAQQTPSPAAQSQVPYTAQQQPYPAQVQQDPAAASPPPNQPFYHHAGSTTSVNRIPSAQTAVQSQPQSASFFPPSSPPTRQVTEPEIAGLSAEDQQGWDQYYQQHGQQAPPSSQHPSQPQSQPQPQQGSYYPAHAQAQGYQAAYATMPDGRAYASPPLPGTQQSQGVEGVTIGMDRMSVHAP
ncbi:class E vacuolar protein-sorting machinery protein HSE1 [Cryptococcus neoformans Tu401-1]|nr:class E vacuolar protein-sorting machinery protein HSE1 [Cryptococcus neoformans var. grubii Bt85]OXG15630.1 class E vacuolar protein-sorting machinery protein HSE1 [Cryptococcus neoformans var. grubii Tu401-1]OXM78267.1 class E vacuolar protein-sorting machinery protein HSE1 [Cryptococcus neoformans var. grubii Bt63]